MRMGGSVGCTFEDESGFADAARAVEDERLRDAVVGVVVEDCFQQWPGDDPPGFVHHCSSGLSEFECSSATLSVPLSLVEKYDILRSVSKMRSSRSCWRTRPSRSATTDLNLVC